MSTIAAPVTSAPCDAIDGTRARADFPILIREPEAGRPRLTYLDSAASSQKPQVVIDTLRDYYESVNANIHRGVYDLSETATLAYEEARRTLAGFINARTHREVVFVRNTTEGINLVANSWGRTNLKAGDLVLVTELEHHSNLVPWQLIAAERGASIEAVRVLPDGTLDLEHYTELLQRGPKLVAVAHVSNSLGTVNPVGRMANLAHAAGAVVVVDGAQSVPHMPVDVQELDCDFLAFSGHKMLGPMGASVLYGKRELLEAMPPFMGGGGMIRKVGIKSTTWADIPARFEAGTPAVGDAIALAEAVKYLQSHTMDRVWDHGVLLTEYALERLAEVPGLVIHGPGVTQVRSAVISFTIDGVHPHDIAAILNEDGVAVRAGHHCNQPLMDALGLVATTRASFYLYNDGEDVDRLVTSLGRVVEVFG
ncbi:MAG TPA: SufS family cysteine desulfurase [Thermomicrobiales bacterium]|nr:SufS family cysteine desulfurase [Thermomicrobiales bacterium]